VSRYLIPSSYVSLHILKFFPPVCPICPIGSLNGHTMSSTNQLSSGDGRILPALLFSLSFLFFNTLTRIVLNQSSSPPSHLLRSQQLPEMLLQQPHPQPSHQLDRNHRTSIQPSRLRLTFRPSAAAAAPMLPQETTTPPLAARPQNRRLHTHQRRPSQHWILKVIPSKMCVMAIPSSWPEPTLLSARPTHSLRPWATLSETPFRLLLLWRPPATLPPPLLLLSPVFLLSATPSPSLSRTLSTRKGAAAAAPLSRRPPSQPILLPPGQATILSPPVQATILSLRVPVPSARTVVVKARPVVISSAVIRSSHPVKEHRTTGSTRRGPSKHLKSTALVGVY